ncbi:hypothetical protein BGX34_003598 [Mortierella sp. NVP85]|nr:hypothetical protein BGX34_003598 [Mortierella sp. NVP85]
MNNTFLQAFTTRSQPKIITIPTRHDPKSKQHVIRWKDILQFFKDAQGVMNGDSTVLFLTDDDLEDLVPLRIAHHPNAILEVVVATDGQHGSDPFSNSHHMTGTLSSADSASNDIRSVMGLRITELNDSQALVMHSKALPSEGRIPLHAPSLLYDATTQTSSISSTDAPTDGGDNRLSIQTDIMAQEEELHQLKEQVQQMQKLMEEAQQDSRQWAQDLQQVLEQVDDVLQNIQLVDQRTHCIQQQLQQQLQQHIDATLPRDQEMDQQRQQMDEVLQKMQQIEQQGLLSQERLQQLMDGAYDQKAPESQQQPTPQIEEAPPRCSDQQEQTYGEQLGQRLDKSQTIQQGDQQEHPEDDLPQLPKDGVTEDQLQQSMPQSPEADQVDRQEIQGQTDDQSCSQDPFSLPRLFIVLPKAAPFHNRDESSSPQFRLHFLCEPDTHSTDKDPSKDIHAIHLTNHPGYDLVSPDEFFHSYGPYLLSMMRRVDLKFREDGLTVPPLILSISTTETTADQDRCIDDMNNFYGLIQETIRILEGMDFNINGDMKETALTPLEWSRLKQHLRVEVGERVTCGLIPMAIQDGYTWVCDEYQGRCHKLTMQRLDELIPKSGGKFSVQENNFKIVIDSHFLERQLRSQVVGLCQDSSKALYLTLRGGQSTGSTTDIVINLTNITSIELEFPRLSMTINISEGQFVDVTMQINHLFVITHDDLDFIRQCCPVRLSIVNTPQKEDEYQLVNIIRHNPKLTELLVGSVGDRSFAIIDLVISTQKRILQEKGTSAPCSRTFKVMDKGLTPFDKDGNFDQDCHVVSTITFPMESTDFDMETDIKLPNGQVSSGSPTQTFIQRYGWSIKILRVSRFSDDLAALIDQGTQKRGSRITHLDLNPSSLTVPGLDALDRAIKRSQSFTDLWLHLTSLESERGLIYAEILLRRYVEKLTSLHINAYSSDIWLPALIRAFPERSDFPALKRFIFDSGGSHFSKECLQWIIFMVSAPSQATTARSPSTTAPPENSPISLGFIDLSRIWLKSDEWGSVIQAMDFSDLIELNLNASNFYSCLQRLDDRIDESGPMQLKRIRIPNSGWDMYRYPGLSTLRTKLGNRNPPIRFEYD